MEKRYYTICEWCCKKVEYIHCFERGTRPEHTRCNVMKGWLTLSCWRGTGSVDQFNFCSFSCLLSWLQTQATKIPKVFLEAFQDE